MRPGCTPHMVRGGSTKRKFEKRAISRFLSDPKPHAKNDQKSPFSRVKSSTTYRLHTGSYRAPTPPIWTPNHPPKGVLVWGAGPPICQSYSQFKIGTRMSWKDHFCRSRQKKKKNAPSQGHFGELFSDPKCTPFPIWFQPSMDL